MVNGWHRLYFDDWVEREGLELIRGHKVENVFTQPLRSWERTGALAVHIQLDGSSEASSAYICEIAPGRELKALRHFYEELIYVLRGSGATTVWYEGVGKSSFEWKAGSIFAIPLNAWHQHFNGSGSEPARFIAVTTAPTMMNFIRNDEFIFNNPVVFPERYDGGKDYFSGEIRTEVFTGWDKPTNIYFSNLWADIHALPLGESIRGVGTRSYNFELANGVLGAHMLEVPGGTYTKLHRHGPGAQVLWLRGEGYSMLWPDGGAKRMEWWGPGTLIVPPNWWWHQHCVVGGESALHLALKLSSRKNVVSRANTGTMRSTRQGGNQLAFEDTPPELLAELHGIFNAECAKRGTSAQMGPVVGY